MDVDYVSNISDKITAYIFTVRRFNHMMKSGPRYTGEWAGTVPASELAVVLHPEDAGRRFLRNVGYTAPSSKSRIMTMF
jgi:hypothetical protein